MEHGTGLVQTRVDENLLWIEICRPDKLNSLNTAVLKELLAVLDAATQDLNYRVLLITSAGGRAFVAGADIAEMAVQDMDGIRKMMDLGKAVTHLLETAPQPAVAMVQGYALGGGCELSLACDLICASERAQFGLPEVDLGIVPGWGGTQRLERRVGYGRARDMVFTGRRIAAEEAVSWGLCDRVFPADRLLEETTALARSLAEKDGEALAGAKRALRWRSELPLSETLRLETDLFVDLFNRPERVRAMNRFLKRE